MYSKLKQSSLLFTSLTVDSVAKDRAWFDEYTPFPFTLGGHVALPTGPAMEVLGVGTVRLVTKRNPNSSGRGSEGLLLLEDVLHVPDAFCNLIGVPIDDMYSVQMGPSTPHSHGKISKHDGAAQAYFDPRQKLCRVMIKGPPVGPRLGRSVLNQGYPMLLGCHWDESERRRWLQLKASRGASSTASQSASQLSDSSLYSPEEKDFIKQNYRNEFHFLREHGLSIYKDEDRAEGRQILRSLMADESPIDDEEAESEESEFDFTGHQVDYAFSRNQLDWIEKHFKNAENFMITYGLKFYDDEDVEEAKSIADALMTDD